MRLVSDIGIEYVFPDKSLTCLACVDCDAGAVLSSVAPGKGSSELVANLVATTLDESWGKTQLVVRTDGEPAVVKLRKT